MFAEAHIRQPWRASDHHPDSGADVFSSILLPGALPISPAPAQTLEPPECFVDLGLDQIVSTVCAPWKEYPLASYFFAPLTREDDIAYRQEIMLDLEHPATMEAIRGFTQRLETARQILPLASKGYSMHESNRWLLECVRLYGEAVKLLQDELRPLSLASRGLGRWRLHVSEYVKSSYFGELMGESTALIDELSAIQYTVHIDGATVSVREYRGEVDYSREVEQVFARFRRGEVKDYSVKVPVSVGLNHIEAQVLDCVARLNPTIFQRLAAFRERHERFVDAEVDRFDVEIHFYIGWLDFIAAYRKAGLLFSYPTVSATSKAESVSDAFDLALGCRLQAAIKSLVTNDFHFGHQERMLVVTGSNQGGKTTFARMFGQLHWLASLGLPVPGQNVKLFLFDRLFTHFEREESLATLRGKLYDDLVRMHMILENASPNSVVVMNEIFSSTTLSDATFLARAALSKLMALDALAVCVTFIDELAYGSEKVVSMVAGLDPIDPTKRTFKIERRAADGLAHALAIAEKYHVTQAWLMERIPS